MAWWRTAGKDAPEAEVLARSAPDLPSEIAKQVEGLAASTSEQIAGGVAAPFVPGSSTLPAATVATATNPGPYPSTAAPSFTPTTPTTAAVPAAPATANLGSLAMPYNPNAVPPAAATATPVTAPATVDRYASASTPSNVSTPGNNAALPAASYPSTASRYGQQVASAAGAAMNMPMAQTATPPTSASGIAAKLGDRYAAAVPAASLPINNSLAEPATPTIPPITAVTEATPFRPGGTSTYPAAVQSPMQVATRPETPTIGGSQTPNTTLPNNGSLPAANTAPHHQVPRYR
ncbi:MAG: hypothetical protein GXP26_10980 [Planctomycetes bacterium]|nr:hypothetical protein [Planctomycetota bacterium]